MIPDYETLMLPVLQVVGEGQTLHARDIRAEVARRLSLTPADLEQLKPSGQQPLFNNRVHRAKTCLEKAGLVEAPARGYVRITDRGREVLARNPARITNRMLAELSPEFRAWAVGSGSGAKSAPADASSSQEMGQAASISPEEAIAQQFLQYRSAVEAELLELLRQVPPARF